MFRILDFIFQNIYYIPYIDLNSRAYVVITFEENITGNCSKLCPEYSTNTVSLLLIVLRKIAFVSSIYYHLKESYNLRSFAVGLQIFIFQRVVKFVEFQLLDLLSNIFLNKKMYLDLQYQFTIYKNFDYIRKHHYLDNIT